MKPPINWQEKKASLEASLYGAWEGISKRFKVSGEERPDVLRRKQTLFLGTGAALVIFVGSWSLGFLDFGGREVVAEASKKEDGPVHIKDMKELSTPLSSVKDGDLWVARIEKLLKGSQQELEKVRQENQFLDKKVALLTQALGHNPESRAKALQELQGGSGPQAGFPLGDGKGTGSGVPPQQPVPAVEWAPGIGAGVLPPVPTEGDASQQNSQTKLATKPAGTLHGVPGQGAKTNKKRKLLHLAHAGAGGNAYKSPEAYLPAGTFFKVVTAMGVVVSTGTNSSSDPQPILLRIVDNGNLPGGLKGKVKDAVLIGSCYGSASAERAICRLKSLTWRDKSGRNIEKPVEGWIASEDGVQGIRAKIIDRSSEVAREAFGAGLLSAASNFLKFDATSSVYPMTPFGQTNAMGKGAALKGAAGTGVGSALDKLAEFSIKRAESMSPVAYVASGRVLDAVLMTGVDLSPLTPDSLQLPVLSRVEGVGGQPSQSRQSAPDLTEPNGDMP